MRVHENVPASELLRAKRTIMPPHGSKAIKTGTSPLILKDLGLEQAKWQGVSRKIRARSRRRVCSDLSRHFSWGVTQGDTEAEAQETTADALSTIIAEHIRRGEPLPRPGKPRARSTA